MEKNSKSKQAEVRPRPRFNREVVENLSIDSPIPQWRYREDNEAEFVFSLALHGFSISSIDDFIECRQGVDVSPEIAEDLCEMREDAFRAYMRNDFELMLAHARALTWACRFYGFRLAISPDAKRGRKVKAGAMESGQSRREGRLVSEEDSRQMCISISRENPSWGLTAVRSKAAENLKVSSRTIQRHVPDLREILNGKPNVE